MIERLLRKVMTAEIMGILLMAVAVQVLTYGVSESLENTDTNYFLSICLVALVIGFGLGKTRLTGIQSSAGIAALGILIVWILGARLTQPLLVFGREVLSVTPEIIPAIRYKEIIDTTAIIEAWKVIAESSSALLARLQTWLVGFNQKVRVNDSLIRNMVWVLILWLCSAWMGWFAKRRNAMTSFLPALAVLAVVTSYSEYRVETLWGMVVILLILMGVWNYRNHTQQWEKSRIDYSDSIRFDNGQAVLMFTLAIGSIAFITPSVSWQDILDYLQEIRTNETAEMLGLQEPRISGKPPSVQKPALPRDHLLTGGYANSENIVMTIRTGELPPIPYQSLTIAAPQYYWRSTIYDQYVSAGWVTSAVFRQNISAETPLIPGLLNGYRVVHLDVEMLEPEGRLFWSGILFSMDIPFTVNWRVKPPSDLFADQTALLQSDMFATSSTVTAYQADVYVPAATVEQLRSASTEYPEELRDRYVRLPGTVPKRVHELALEITDGITNPYDKAKAIESYLRTNYPYDLEVPGPPEGRDVADYFLFDLQKGYCDYYATTMVVLARSSGLPARFVSGYAPGYYDAPNAEYVIRELNAHSWVEIYFPNIGWVEFEPTASIPEIDRAGGGVPLPEDQNEESASNLIAQFRLEKILLWSSPALGILLAAIIYFAIIERWMYLRLAPAVTIERIHQNFYRAGRALAGEWTYAETSSEFLQKFNYKVNELGSRSRFTKLLGKLVINANALTELYSSTLFESHQVQKQDAYTAWQTWNRLRMQLFFTKFFIFRAINKHHK